jgi:hypothetical protein
MLLRMTAIVLVACAALAPAAVPAAEDALVEFRPGDSQVEITVGGAPLATYVFADEVARRPYLAHVHAPGGVQVTRNHPPVEGVDATDHATFHPGIWLAFGALGENDFWRNKSRVVHDGFVEEPAGGANAGSFAVRNLYLDERDPEQVVCREVCRLRFLVRPAGYLIVWDSTFSNDDRPFAFGDQEEMGLGVRVATGITELGGGTLRDSEGRTTAAKIWGKTAAWCDYSGRIGDTRVGAALFCHPDNFRPSWMHVRDYGLMTANAFGREAFAKGPESRVTVQPGESLRLRYGVLLHANSSDQPQVDMAAAYDEYLRLSDR